MRHIHFAITIVIIVLFSDILSPVYADEMVISTCDFESLQSAIYQENSDDITISFACSETIVFTYDLSIHNNLTIMGEGNIIFDGDNETRFFHVYEGTLTLDGLTLQNGNYRNRMDSYGGAIYNDNGNIIITNSTFTHNTALDGGAIYNNSGEISITNSSFSDNSADGGGAIYNGYLLNIQSSEFLNNSAGFGGAIYNAHGTLTITDSTLSNNSTTKTGGAILNDVGTLTITNSTLSDNSADEQGSAIYNYLGTLISQDSHYENNTCEDREDRKGEINDLGGNIVDNAYGCPGVKSPPEDATVRNCNNLMDAGGFFEALQITNRNGGTISFECDGTLSFLDPLFIQSDVTIIGNGNIIFDGTNTTQLFRVEGGASLVLQNLILKNGNGEYGGVIFNGGGVVTIDNCTLDNNFAEFGGAIHNGVDSTLTITNSVLSNNSVQSDYGGRGGAIVNSGTIHISNSDISYNTAFFGGSIVNYARGIITMDNNTFSYNSGRVGVAIINNGMMTINTTTFSHHPEGDMGVIENSYDGTLIIDNSVFSNNSTAIHHFSTGTVTIKNSTFSDNTSVNGAGAIENSSIMNISDSMFLNNSTNKGGGAIQNSDVLTINDTTFSDNSALQDGGAIQNYHSGTLSTTNSIFSNNSALSGGAISNQAHYYYIFANTLSITNSTFSDNSATNNGGAISNQTGIITISESLFNNNSASQGGAIFNFSMGEISIIASTFSDNLGENNEALINYSGTISTQDSYYTNNACVGEITDNGGNTVVKSDGCAVTVALDVSRLFCVGNDLQFTIYTGDATFDITGTGEGLPLNDVGIGTYTIEGAGTWADVIITERYGGLQSINLGGITCP